MPRYSIYFVSAPCGAGKSHGACRYIQDNLFEKNLRRCNWSRRLPRNCGPWGAKQAGDDGTAIIEAMDLEAAALFGGDRFLFVTNSDRNALSLEEVPGSRRTGEHRAPIQLPLGGPSTAGPRIMRTQGVPPITRLPII